MKIIAIILGVLVFLGIAFALYLILHAAFADRKVKSQEEAHPKPDAKKKEDHGSHGSHDSHGAHGSGGMSLSFKGVWRTIESIVSGLLILALICGVGIGVIVGGRYLLHAGLPQMWDHLPVYYSAPPRSEAQTYEPKESNTVTAVESTVQPTPAPTGCGDGEWHGITAKATSDWSTVEWVKAPYTMTKCDIWVYPEPRYDKIDLQCAYSVDKPANNMQADPTGCGAIGARWFRIRAGARSADMQGNRHDVDAKYQFTPHTDN